MAAKELMTAADQLSGIRPTMTHSEIHERTVSMTRESLTLAYLLEQYRKTRDGDERTSLRTRIADLVTQKPSLQTPEITGLLKGVSITAGQSGRPRKHVTDAARRREASRAYRARKRAQKP